MSQKVQYKECCSIKHQGFELNRHRALFLCLGLAKCGRNSKRVTQSGSCMFAQGLDSVSCIISFICVCVYVCGILKTSQHKLFIYTSLHCMSFTPGASEAGKPPHLFANLKCHQRLSQILPSSLSLGADSSLHNVVNNWYWVTCIKPYMF